LAREGELPVPEVARILRDVAHPLAYAHTGGLVHRDIKPDNVLISGHHAMVTDFGVAKAISEATGRTSLTSMGVALGTPAYMAPEQATADPHVDHRADLYALGALGYEMLTGRPPFVGTSPHQVLAAQVTELPDWVLPAAIGLLAVGLPIMVWTGVIERRRALARTTGRAIAPVGLHRWFTWRRALLGGVGAFGTLGVGTAIYMGMRLLGIGPV